MTVIRRATKNDIEAVLGLWRQLVDYHAGLGSAFQASPEAEDVFRKFLKKGLKRSDVLVQVAQENDRLVGLCTTFIESNPPIFGAGRYGKVADLVVDEPYRKRGIATALLASAKKWLRENDIEVCRVFVAKSNSASSGFWSGAGFQEHIAIMERDISEPPDGDRLR